MKYIYLVAAFTFALPFQSAATPLEKGSWNVGGAARLPLKWDPHGNLKAGVEVTPTAAYIFADGWEVFGALRIEGTFYQGEAVRSPREPIKYGGQVGVMYYFDWNLGFFPFIGAATGLEVADFKVVSTKLSLELPIGIAFLVSENLMVQIGAPVRLSLEPPFSGGTAHYSWTPGYIGARIYL